MSPPYKKRITGQQKIEEFTILFNDRKKKPVFSIINSSGWSKRAIITTETYQYDIIFCGGEHYGEQTKICHGQIDRF